MIDTASAAVDVKRWGVRRSGIQLILSRGAGDGALAAPTTIDRVTECGNLSIYPTNLAEVDRRRAAISPHRLTLDRMKSNDHAG
jgi:hypothetical protein